MADRASGNAREPALVAMAAVTLAVTSGRSTGFRPAATHRRAGELLHDLVSELSRQGVSDVGCATVSVISVDDSGVGIEVGVVVSGPVDEVEGTVRLVERPAHAAVTALVPGEQTDRAWRDVHRFVAEAGLSPRLRPSASFLHPRPDDGRASFTQLVQPVVADLDLTAHPDPHRRRPVVDTAAPRRGAHTRPPAPGHPRWRTHMSQTTSTPTVAGGPDPAFRRDVSDLDAVLAGRALAPGDTGYDDACAGYNLAGVRHPDVVVTAHGQEDVVAAVRFAAAHGLPVAVLATGHHALRPLTGGMLIATAAMNEVRVDAAARRAVVGAGAQWNDVVPLTVEQHLSPVHGSSGQVGAVGFTLGGGLSPVLGRRYGWGSDHVVALDVVTADGEVVRASADEHPDLFWALRGGRSSLGIVTSMEIELFPVERFVGGGLFFDGEHAPAVLSAFARATATAPDDLTLSLAFLRLPPVPGVPPLLAGRFVLHLRVAFLGDADEADALLAPLRAAAPVIVDTVEETGSADFERIHQDPTDPAPFSEDTTMLAELAESAQHALLDLVGPRSDTRLHIVELRHLGGAFAATRPGAGAIAAEPAEYVLWAVSIGMPADDHEGIASARALMDAVAPWSTGKRYVNFAPDDGHPERSFAADDWNRLQQVKAAVDPANRFRTQDPVTES